MDLNGKTIRTQPAIRSMAEGDLDGVIEIAAELASAPQWPRSAYRAAIQPDQSQRRIALVAELEGEPAGFAIASVIGPHAELETIAVACEAQRLGIGMALLTRLIDELRLAAAKEIDLERRESNRAAAGLYERAGFREVGRRRGYYSAPAEDAVLLRLMLNL